MKDLKKLFYRNNWCPCQNAFEKCSTNTELCNGKSYIKKLHTRLQLQMFMEVPT